MKKSERGTSFGEKKWFAMAAFEEMARHPFVYT